MDIYFYWPNPWFSKKINEMNRQLELLPKAAILDLATLENDLLNNEFGKVQYKPTKMSAIY